MASAVSPFVLEERMKNEKKVAFQSKRIAELEKQVKCLEAENKSMEKDIDRYKKIISSKDVVIGSLQSKAAEYKKCHDAEMHEVFELKANLRTAISDAKASRAKYEKEMKSLIDRFRKRK